MCRSPRRVKFSVGCEGFPSLRIIHKHFWLCNFRRRTLIMPVILKPPSEKFGRRLPLFISIIRNIFRNISAAFFVRFNAFGEEVFDLPVYRSEIALCPFGKLAEQFRAYSQRNLLFLFLAHLNKDFPNLLRAERRDYRKELRADWKP